MSGYALIEAVKAKKGINSDNKLATLLGISRQSISNWKNKDNATPDTQNVLDIMIFGGFEALETKELLNKKQSGFITLSQLLTTSLAGIALLASFIFASQCILCKMRKK